MESAEQLYLGHLDEHMLVMHQENIDRSHMENYHNVYRHVMNKDETSLLKTFSLWKATEEENLPAPDQWRGIQFQWKNIVLATCLRVSIHKFTPVTMAQLFSLLNTINDMKPHQYREGAQFLTARLIHLYEKGVEEYAEVTSPRVAKAIQSIYTNLTSEDLRLQTVADDLGVSAPYLSKIFHDEIGEPITLYIHKKKIEASTEHLLFSDRTIGEISQMHGYTSTTTYCRKFKEIKEQSPMQYRKSYAR